MSHGLNTFLNQIFGYPLGGVYANFIASAIWAIPGYLYGRYHVKKIHKHLQAHSDKLEIIHAHIKRSKQ